MLGLQWQRPIAQPLQETSYLSTPKTICALKEWPETDFAEVRQRVAGDGLCGCAIKNHFGYRLVEVQNPRYARAPSQNEEEEKKGEG